MTPADHQRASNLFEQLRKLPESARAAALDSACTGDSGLRERVWSLLEADRDADGASFLETRAVEDAAAMPTLGPTNFPAPPGSPPATHRLGPLAPGTRFGPYQVTTLLGVGGMGEVYRAHDAKLHRDVAIKVLPAALVSDMQYMARFEREAQVLASLNHPNIATIYGVEQGALVMELVEGANLRGPLALEEAIPIARQIAAGLEAAHERGVVHRDLKPANIRITPEGVVKLLDFGLATPAGGGSAAPSTPGGSPAPEAAPGMTQAGAILGTASYMSPEQARGKRVDKRTDIWAFGVVLYEMLTGQQLFGRDTVADTLATVVNDAPDLDSLPAQTPPHIRRLLSRCLRKDVATRLRDIGEARVLLDEPVEAPATPARQRALSPEMVAAAGGQGALERGPAWMLLGAVIAGIAIIFALAPWSTELGLAPMELSPDLLRAKAEAVVKKLGYPDPPADEEIWFDRNQAFLVHRSLHVPSREGWRTLRNADQSHQLFRYRQSPQPMNAMYWLSGVTVDDPPWNVSGMVNLTLDFRGPLLSFVAVPPQLASAAPETKPGERMDWTALFDESGLDRLRFRPESPVWVPPVPFDNAAGWEGTYPQDPLTPIHVIAASFRGKAVYFEVTGPWSLAVRQIRTPVSATARLNGFAIALSVIGLLGVSMFVALRNHRLGVADSAGTLKVSGFTLAAFLARNVVYADHGSSLEREYFVFFENMGLALVLAAFVGLMYMALEPYVRRHWPRLLVGWSRVLNGQFRDPLVGRDILIGCLFGVAVALACFAACAVPAFLDVRGWTAFYPDNWTSYGRTNRFLALLLDWFGDAVLYALYHTLILFLALGAARKRPLGLLLAWLLIAVVHLRGEALWLDLAQAAMVSALIVVVISRHGILACAVTMYCAYILWATPFTLVSSYWYAARSTAMVALCLGLAIHGFRTSLGGKPALATGLLD